MHAGQWHADLIALECEHALVVIFTLEPDTIMHLQLQALSSSGKAG